ncbi:hypothetical protein [Cypionkella sp.]|jgi:hypothetical protein|uniref:hypothetical protein n=1 Tax=Cypionkella sp. TaxID=2811411 RepID=UPI002FDD2F79
MTATPLIGSLFFVNKDTSPLAGVTPMTIAISILALGSLGFLIRALQYFGVKRSPSESGK